ncbi:MAG: deoxyribodipyrimidine photo-lyase, partial [Betaproteobacteria bacterium]|nr:deoxyribodipyrimidine photo-lyase [Betaproteobacteria bacterium]
MSTRALVWFKRDLRLHDHAPLLAAADCDQALAVFVVEPEWLQSPEFAPRHLSYLLQCLRPLREALARRGLPLLVRSGGLPEVFEQLRRDYAFSHLFSHEETGPGWSYARDRAVARWCRAAGVSWRQWPQGGVVRGLRRREGWARQWQLRMDAPRLEAPQRWRGADGWRGDPVGRPRDFGVAEAAELPAAGEAAARQDLDSFLLARGRHYRR